MIKKLCIRSLQRGIGSMDYVDSLLLIEDEDENDSSADEGNVDTPVPQMAALQPAANRPVTTIRPPNEPLPEWCRCGNCRSMPQEIEKKCCKKKTVWLQDQGLPRYALTQMFWSYV